MKEWGRFGFNILLMTLLALAVSALQTSLWLQVFGFLPSPCFWLPIVIYLILNRNKFEGLANVYWILFVLSPQTVAPEGTMMLAGFAVYLIVKIFKERIFWPGLSYFTLVSSISVILFHLSLWILSYYLQSHSMGQPEILHWISEAVLTPIAAAPLYFILTWIDRVTEKEINVENRTGQEVA